MPLSDAKVKAAKVPEDKKQLKLSDGGGLYLMTTLSGKYWRLNYRFGGKQKTLAVGVYPSVSLKEARDKRERARKLLEKNIDPSQAKQQERRKRHTEELAATFEGVAREWLDKNKAKWVPAYTKRMRNWLENDVLPWVGSLPIVDIKAVDILAVIRKAESRGAIETAHKLRTICGQVLRYAVATTLIESDPSRDLHGALEPVITTHRATITEPKKVGELLRAIDGFEGTFIVQCALRITPYVFTRPGELRHAEWSEVALEAAEWRIPAEKMKMKELHIVPLSKQVVEVLRDLQALTGAGKYVFPSIRSSSRPMSENTVNASLRRIGYAKDEMCAHGFRAMASTLLHEHGWKSDIIERQLAHKEGNAIKGAYNHARHLPERVEMMQAWADYLDALREGSNVIPIKAGAKV